MLPIALGLMMLAMGLSLTFADFQRIARYPKAAVLGILMQLFLLPLIAWVLILSITNFIPLSSELAQLLFLGLIILAACPGGATSNIISYLAGGDVALSISMTAVVSILVPFVVPVSLAYQFSWLGEEAIALHLPFAKTALQLLLVTVIPVLVGMVVRHHWTASIVKLEPLIGKLIGALFVCLILVLMFVQWPKLQEMGVGVMLVCLSLCMIAMLLAYSLAKFLGFSYEIKKTLAIEVGFQNAGTGMFIAAVLLGRPDWALVPLMYGLIMNLPAFILIVINSSLNSVRLKKS